MFDWIRKKNGATVPELFEQLDAAKKAHTEAQATIGQAETVFDADGSDKSAKALSKARDDARLAEEHLGRARRMIPARITDLAQGAIERLQSERERLNGPATAEANRRLAAAQQVVNDLEEQLANAEAHKVSIQHEHHEIWLTDNKLEKRIAHLQTERDEAMQFDIDTQRQRLITVAAAFESATP